MRLKLATLAVLLLPTLAAAEQFDVLVYGGTPAGIAAAVAAESEGEKVLLVEPGDALGGMLSNGLSHGEFRPKEPLSGPYLDLARRVEAFYEERYGAGSRQVKECGRGAQAEPHVYRAVLERMAAEHAGVTVSRGWILEALQCSSPGADEIEQFRAVETALFFDRATGEKHTVSARLFIDASYEGDLMAAAGVKYAVGREAGAEHEETLAPAEADARVQGYDFHFCMTRVGANRIAPPVPEGYDRSDYERVAQLVASGRIRNAFGTSSDSALRLATPALPNGKYEVTDWADGPIRLSLPGENAAWPDGSGGVALRESASGENSAPPFSRVGLAIARGRIFQEHMQWSLGLIYFLQNDPALPKQFRQAAAEWGFCRDEFVDGAYVPSQLHVREARRMIGLQVFTERQAMRSSSAEASAAAPLGLLPVVNCGLSCRGTGREGPMIGGRTTGSFEKQIGSFGVPYGVMVPQDVENLLVVGAVSATHVGFCALAYEPVRMSLGEAAGFASHLARIRRIPVQKVPLEVLRDRVARERKQVGGERGLSGSSAKDGAVR